MCRLPVRCFGEEAITAERVRSLFSLALAADVRPDSGAGLETRNLAVSIPVDLAGHPKIAAWETIYRVPLGTLIGNLIFSS